MAASALVYLTSLHPDREQRAARGGPSGEMFMSGSLLAGLSDLGYEVNSTGTLRRFLGIRAGQALRFQPPNVVFLDPWSLALAARYKALPRRSSARRLVLEWFGTTRAAIPKDSGLTPQAYLVPYPYPAIGNSFLGFMLRGEGGAFLADESELRNEFERALARPRPFAVVWGKEPRYFGAAERSLIRALALRIPMHLTVPWGDVEPISGEGIVNHGCLDPEAWRGLLRDARFVLGLGDPVLGPTALEALAAGAVLLNPSFKPPRLVDGNPGVAFDSQHGYAAEIGPPHVHAIEPGEQAGVVRTVETLLAEDPGVRPLPRGLAAFTRDAYVPRLAAILGRTRP